MREFTREELNLVLNIHSRWEGMLDRCNFPFRKGYENYGGRGIKVCAEWQRSGKNREGFLRFFEYVSKLPHFGEEGYTLDRIDNDGDYEPGNIRWATAKIQARNRRSNAIIEDLEGDYITLAAASEKYGIRYSTLLKRYEDGKRGAELLSNAHGHAIKVDGKTFRELSLESGISAETLCDRYRRGDRGQKLLRPLEKNKSHKRK